MVRKQQTKHSYKSNVRKDICMLTEWLWYFINKG